MQDLAPARAALDAVDVERRRLEEQLAGSRQQQDGVQRRLHALQQELEAEAFSRLLTAGDCSPGPEFAI
jgi:chromosome segregation ATPase